MEDRAHIYSPLVHIQIQMKSKFGAFKRNKPTVGKGTEFRNR